MAWYTLASKLTERVFCDLLSVNSRSATDEQLVDIVLFYSLARILAREMTLLIWK